MPPTRCATASDKARCRFRFAGPSSTLPSLYSWSMIFRDHALSALTRRLLVEPRLHGARFQRGLDLGELHAARLEHDQQMIDEVGGLGDQVLAILRHRGQRRLHRLLAELLGAMDDTPVDQLASIG